MTGREWKPGDVVVMPGTGKRAIVTTADVRPFRTQDDVEQWGDAINGVEVRPLVVIDPEDRDQVERLTAALFSEIGGDWPDGYTANETQAALRKFADRQPQVTEPMGLGAVVEDDEGRTWIRTNGRPGYEWYLPNQCIRPWSFFTAVRVLHEGMAQ